MAKKQKSDRITPANIIAIVGIVLLLIFSYIGQSYMSGGEMGWDIVISVGITAFTALLLWFMIKAKGAENHLNLWKKVEYTTLALYILFAVPASLFGGIMHFFVVNSEKDNIKMYAKQDLEKINKVFEDYKAFESEAISRTGTGLQNATGLGQVCDANLNKFFNDNSIQHTRESAQNFETIQRSNLLGSGYENFYENFVQEKDNILAVVNGWSIIQIPMKAKQMSDLATKVQEELNKLSQKAKLPVVTLHPNLGQYTIIQENQTKTFEIDVESFQFKKALQEADGFSVTAILVVLLIHFLILLNYIVAYRTSTLGITKKGEEDGGMVLK